MYYSQDSNNLNVETSEIRKAGGKGLDRTKIRREKETKTGRNTLYLVPDFHNAFFPLRVGLGTCHWKLLYIFHSHFIFYRYSKGSRVSIKEIV